MIPNLSRTVLRKSVPLILKKVTKTMVSGRPKETFQEISKGAFATGGYGKWKKLNPQTIKRKGSSEILIDTNSLSKNIHNWIVDK